MTARWNRAAIGAAFLIDLALVVQPGSAQCGGTLTGFFVACEARPVALDCSHQSAQSWPAAEPIRIAVQCFDVGCPPPLPGCRFPEDCNFAEGAPVIRGI